MNKKTSIPVVSTHNITVDSVQGDAYNYSQNNFSSNPSVQDLNRIITGVNFAMPNENVERGARFFGEHVREGIAIVKDWVKHP